MINFAIVTWFLLNGLIEQLCCMIVFHILHLIIIIIIGFKVRFNRIQICQVLLVWKTQIGMLFFVIKYNYIIQMKDYISSSTTILKHIQMLCVFKAFFLKVKIMFSSGKRLYTLFFKLYEYLFTDIIIKCPFFDGLLENHNTRLSYNNVKSFLVWDQWTNTEYLTHKEPFTFLNAQTGGQVCLMTCCHSELWLAVCAPAAEGLLIQCVVSRSYRKIIGLTVVWIVLQNTHKKVDLFRKKCDKTSLCTQPNLC